MGGMVVQDRPYWVREPTQNTMERLQSIAGIVENHDRQLTVRAITYKLYGEEVHGKELENAYSRTCKDVVRARVLGLVPWSAISEERVQRGGGGGWRGPESYLQQRLDPDSVAQGFRLDRSPAHERPLQVWYEKDTVTDFFREVCREFGVRYVCTRGQMPWTAKKNAADDLPEDALILYFGDNDPKGREIRDVIRRDLRFLADRLDEKPPSVEWAGVTDDHEERFDLPGEARLDGVDPGDLQEMVADEIREHVDVDELERIVTQEGDHRDEIRETMRDSDIMEEFE